MVTYDKDFIYIQAPLSIMPPWNFKQVEDVFQDLDFKKEHIFVWSWTNEKEGIVRARTFAPDWGIPEDEANGSGSMLLAAKSKRNLKIIHGKGSMIFARYIDEKTAEVGGFVNLG